MITIGIIILIIISLSGIPGINAIGPYVQVIWFNGLCYIAILRNIRINPITSSKACECEEPTFMEMRSASTHRDRSGNNEDTATTEEHKDGGMMMEVYDQDDIKLDDILNHHHGFEEFMTFLVQLSAY